MISIAIVDDEQMYLDKEKRITEEYFRRKGQECRIELFQDAEWLLCELEEKKFDIYVLDVEMPGRNGLDAARGIRMLYPDPVIIFATNFIDYAVEAYEVNTYRYIPKEVLVDKLTAAYDALLPGLMEREEKYYVIEKKGNIEKISYDDIYYLKKDGKYTVLIHKRGEGRVRKSLSELFEELDSEEFLFIEKGFIVNIRHVMKMKDHVLYMRDGSKLPVVIQRVTEVKRKIAEYWRC